MRIERVLISDDIDAVCADTLKAEGIHVDVRTKLDQGQLCELVKNYDALLVRSATKVTAAVLQAGHLQLVGRAGTGVDNVDLHAATNCGTVVINTPSGNSQSACELTCALLCSLARQVPQAAASMKQGRWDRKLFMGSELADKTLAVIGLGRIGREVAARMQAFRMKTIGFDPMVSKEAAAQFGVELLSLEEIWPRADYITLHVPLMPSTKDLVCTASLSKCKRGVRVINVARGGVINEADLLAALQQGQVAAAALDVFEQEPPSNQELVAHPNVIATPHLGASTNEAQRRVAQEIAQNIVEINAGRGLPGAVNVGGMAAALDTKNEPLLSTVQACAQLCRALCPCADVQQVVVQCAKSDGGLSTALCAAAALGLLKSSTSNGVNYLNAQAHAQAAGIQVSVKPSAATAAGCVSVSCGPACCVGALMTPLGACLTAVNGAALPGVLCDAPLLYCSAGVDKLRACLGDASGDAAIVTFNGGCLARWPKETPASDLAHKFAGCCDQCAFVQF